MLPTLPPRSNPDADALARGQARLLADLSRLQSTEPTEPRPTDAPPAEATHAPWIGTQAAWEAAEPAPTSQRYAFAEVFARGGLGRVRRASDRKLGRTVAIKELLRFDDPAVHRFAREAAITARLQHPGIIPLYDLGRDDHGRPFLCMKLVEGGSLAERIAACPDLAARLALVPHVIAAADAVAYAHQHQVIHRDLKPANILVGEFGETVVIDWGLAKDLSLGPDPELAPDGPADTISDLTAAGSLLGTLRYMPPEQARGEPVDARSDVYALGAVLYHLIAGAPPFHAPPPSELLREILARGPAPLTDHAPAVPPALAAIVRRAMQRDPALRYSSAEALADDLRRFEAGRLVGAHAYSAAELGRLWLRRHRGVATVAAASLVLLTGLAGLAFTRIGAERDRAESARQTAESARQTAESALLAAESDRALAQQRADEAQRSRTRADRSADQLRIQQARSTIVSDPAATLTELARLTHDAANDGPARLLALAAQAHGLPQRTLHGPRSAVLDVHSLADGSILAREQSGQIWRWAPGSSHGEALAADGTLVSSPDGAHWARLTHDLLELHRAGQAPRSIAIDLPRGPAWYTWHLHPDGGTLVASTVLDVPAVIVDLTRDVLEPLPGPDAPALLTTARALTPAPGGRIIAALHGADRLLVWHRDTGSLHNVRLPAPAIKLEAIEFSDDARTLLVHCDGDRLLVRRDDGSTRVVLARRAAVARDTLVLQATDGDGTRLWAEPVAGGPPLWTRTTREAFSTAGPSRPLMLGDHGLARVQLAERWEIFDISTGGVRHSRAGSWSDPLRLARDQQIVVATPGEDAVHRLQILDLATSPWSSLAPPLPPGQLGRAAFASNARFAVRQGGAGQVERLDLTRDLREPLPSGCGAWTSEPLFLASADDGRTLLADIHGHACLWRADTTHPLNIPAQFVADLRFAPDGAGFAIAMADGNLLTWDRPDAEPRRSDGLRLRYSPDGRSTVIAAGATTTLQRSDGPAIVLPQLGSPHGLGLAFTLDSSHLALHHRDAAAVHILATRDGTPLRTLPAPRPLDLSPAGQGLRFSPTGQTLALADGDRLYLWQLGDSTDTPATLDRIHALEFAFIRDEHTLVVLDLKGNLLLADPVAGLQIPLRSDTASASQPRLAVTDDTAYLLTATGELLRWRDTLPPRGDALRTWLATTAKTLELP